MTNQDKLMILSIMNNRARSIIAFQKDNNSFNSNSVDDLIKSFIVKNEDFEPYEDLYNEYRELVIPKGL